MNAYAPVLGAAHDILLHNWPSTDVPDTLVKAGFAVTVYGGPEPDNISVSELVDGEVISRKTGVQPTHVDLMYVYPWPGFDLERDLPGVADHAQALGASTLWYQSGRNSDGSDNPESSWLADAEAARVEAIAKAAGLIAVHDAYIAQTARELQRDD